MGKSIRCPFCGRPGATESSPFQSMPVSGPDRSGPPVNSCGKPAATSAMCVTGRGTRNRSRSGIADAHRGRQCWRPGPASRWRWREVDVSDLLRRRFFGAIGCRLLIGHR
jgi:hypothetical protein